MRPLHGVAASVGVLTVLSAHLGPSRLWSDVVGAMGPWLLGAALLLATALWVRGRASALRRSRPVPLESAAVTTLHAVLRRLLGPHAADRWAAGWSAPRTNRPALEARRAARAGHGASRVALALVGAASVGILATNAQGLGTTTALALLAAASLVGLAAVVATLRRTRPPRPAPSPGRLALLVLAVALESAALALLARAVLGSSTLALVAAAPLLRATLALPGLPGAVPTYEAAFVAVFWVTGAGFDDLLAAALATHLLLAALAVLGATAASLHLARTDRAPDMARSTPTHDRGTAIHRLPIAVRRRRERPSPLVEATA